MPKPTNVVYQDDLEWLSRPHGQLFDYRRKMLSAAAGARRLGCSLFEIPPGKCAFPFHFHCRNEEAIYVLEGSGTLRIGADEIIVRQGAYISLPVGPATAHRLVNSSDRPLRYLCFSTMEEPDVVLYPDSNKIGVLAKEGAARRENRRPTWVFKQSSEVGYFDDEPDS